MKLLLILLLVPCFVQSQDIKTTSFTKANYPSIGEMEIYTTAPLPHSLLLKDLSGSYYLGPEIKSYPRSVTGIGNIEVYIPTNPKKVKLPVLIFFPGMGETGDNAERLYTYGNGVGYSPLFYVRNGWKPDFIIVACQPPANFPNVNVTLAFRDWVLKNLPTDSVFSMTGLSQGGAQVAYYPREAGSRYLKPYALAPMSVTVEPSCSGTLCNTDLLWKDFKSWGFVDRWGDAAGDKMTQFFWKLQAAGFPARITNYSGGHCCWERYYDPSYIDPVYKTNIYEYIMPKVEAEIVIPPVVTPPVVTPPVVTVPINNPPAGTDYFLRSKAEEIFNNLFVQIDALESSIEGLKKSLDTSTTRITTTLNNSETKYIDVFNRNGKYQLDIVSVNDANSASNEIKTLVIINGKVSNLKTASGIPSGTDYSTTRFASSIVTYQGKPQLKLVGVKGQNLTVIITSTVNPI